MSSKQEDIQQAWGALFVAQALAVQAIEQDIAGKAPLSLAEYDVLLHISRSVGGKIRFSTLAAATLFTKSGITRVIARLEKLGFLARVQCDEDKRGSFALLTPKGKVAMRDTWKFYSEAIHTLLDPALDQAEARTLRRLLEKIIARTAGQDALITIKKK